MKNIKLLSFIFLALFATKAMSQEVVIDDIHYNLNAPAKGEATVMPTSHGNSSYSGDIFIPETVTYDGNTYTVTVIGADAFKGSTISSISIPSTVRSLENKALFQSTLLVTIRCNALTPPDVSGELSFQNLKGSKVTLIVPGQSIQEYANHPYWKRFIQVADSDGEGTEGGTEGVVVLTNYEIIDSQTTFLEKPTTAGQQVINTAFNEFHFVTYKRNFKNTNWQALYVPIELVYSDWSENFEIAKIHSILETNGMFYAMADVLESEDTVEPHQLYLIRAKEAGEYTISVSKTERADQHGNPLHKVYTSNTDANGIEPVIATSESFKGDLSGATYTFTGQYTTTGITNDGATYAMSGGALCQPTAGMTVPLGAFRWLLNVTATEGGTLFTAGRINSDGRSNIDESTSTDKILVDLNEIESLDVYYDLSGRCVENPSNGIYIKNGKKVFIK